MADDENVPTSSPADGGERSNERGTWNLGNVSGINRLTSSRASLQDMMHRLIPPELQQNYMVIGEIRAPPSAVNLMQSLQRGPRRNHASRQHGHNHLHPYQHPHHHPAATTADGHTHSHLASAAMTPVLPASPGPVIAGISPDSGNSSVILNMFDHVPNSDQTLQTNNNNEETAESVQVAQVNQGANGAGFGHTHTTQNNARPATDQENPIQLRRYISLQGCIPFIILLLAKILCDHRLGILMFVAMFGTFIYANNVLVRYVAHRDNTKQLLAVILLLSVSIALLYFCFSEQELYKSLYFHLPRVAHVDIWTLFWIVGVADFVIRFSVIILKSFVAILSKYVLKHKQKGKYLSLLEYIGQLYTSLIPVTPWVSYLMDDLHGGNWFSFILLCLYTICKGQHLLLRAKMLRKAVINFRNDQRFGTHATEEDISAADNCCAICQDQFTDPIKLACKHVFCEDCITMWFVRERTCPMCRAQVVNTEGMLWRDGSTTAYVQFY